jgi:hypothetical protein
MIIVLNRKLNNNAIAFNKCLPLGKAFFAIRCFFLLKSLAHSLQQLFICNKQLIAKGLAVFFILIAQSAKAQSIIDPSSNPKYDSLKAASIYSNTPGVSFTTDSADYQPGSTVHFSGGGFFANETVVLQVTLKGNPPGYGAAYNPFNVVCNSNGDFNAYWYVDSQNLGRELEATVIGLTSGYTSSVLFTDGTPS